MHFGYEPGALLADADLVIVLEFRRAVDSAPAASAGRLPCRPCGRRPVLCALSDALVPERSQRSGRRHQRAHRAGRGGRATPAGGGSAHRVAPRPPHRAHAPSPRPARQGFRPPATTISPEYLSHVIGETVGPDAVIFNEYPLRHDHCPREKPGTFFSLGPGRRTGLGLRRRARRQAGGAREVHRRDARRRRPHVRQPDRRPLGVGGTPTAGAGDRVQQQPLRRGAQSHALHVQGWRRRRKRRPRARRSQLRPRPTTRSPTRRAPMPSAWKSRPICRRRFSARAKLSSRDASKRCSTSLRLIERRDRSTKKRQSRSTGPCASTPIPISCRRSSSPSWWKAAIPASASACAKCRASMTSTNASAWSTRSRTTRRSSRTACRRSKSW